MGLTVSAVLLLTGAAARLTVEDCLQLWVYKCIQQFLFLIPKISRHPLYPKVLAAHQESKGQHMLHLVSRKADI